MNCTDTIVIKGQLPRRSTGDNVDGGTDRNSETGLANRAETFPQPQIPVSTWMIVSDC